MKNSFEKIKRSETKKPEIEEAGKPIAPEDLDYGPVGYETDLEAQHRDADKIWQKRKDDAMLQKHEAERHEELLNNLQEDREELDKLYRPAQKK